MDLPSPTPYQNGHSKDEAPLHHSGASAAPQSPQVRTVFPQDVHLWGRGAFFYLLHRFHVGGVTAGRLASLLWLVLAAIWALGALPGRWIGTGLWLLVFMLQVTAGLRERRSDYVTFAPSELPALSGAPLTPAEKLPVHATGLFNVEGKYQRFVWLPGFFRTFATGEHAVLCLVRERRRWFLLSSAPQETGMWYAFVDPGSLQQVRWGTLTFGATASPAIEATYRLTLPPTGRRQQPTIREETLYLAFSAADDGQRIYVDLAQHLPQSAPAPETAPTPLR